MNTIIRIIKHLLIKMFSAESFLARKWVGGAYKRLMWAEWSLPPNPENFDHNINIYYHWPKTGECSWLERGIYNLNAIKMFGKPETVVELCCGDGFNAKNFYAESSQKVYACDYDKNIIRHAQRVNNAHNITYRTADIRVGIENIFPEIQKGAVDCVIWDAGLEYFREEEISGIIENIKMMLRRDVGILSGYEVAKKDSGLHTEHHKFEFQDMEALKMELSPFFKNVMVMESVYDNRHNLYFYASDGIIPFSDEWEHWTNNRT